MPHVMLHPMLQRRSTSGPTHRRTARLTVVLAGIALLAALLAGCTSGGSTGAYQCTAPQHTNGCETTINFSHSHINPDNNPDIDADPMFVQSDALVVPLTCDSACQASSGTGNPPGFIYNFVALVQSNGGYFLEEGYTTSPKGLMYFMQYYMPGINNGKYTHQNLALAPTGDGGNTLNFKYAQFAIGQLGDDVTVGKKGDWVVVLVPPYGQFANKTISANLGQSTFQPDTVLLGQFVYGTSGANAQDAFFADNGIWTAPDWPFGGLDEDGSPPSPVQTVDHPTDAGWFIKASQSSSGGMFRVSCC